MHGQLSAESQGAIGRLEQRLVALVELFGGVPTLALVIVDRDLNVVDAGAGIERLCGRPAHELAGQAASLLFHEDGVKALRAAVEDRARLRAGFACLLELRRSGVKPLLVRALVSETFDPPGAFALLLQRWPPPPAPGAETPETSTAPVAVAELLEGVAAAALVLADGKIVEANRSARSWLGEPLSGCAFEERIAVEDLLVVRDRLRRAESGEQAPPCRCGVVSHVGVPWVLSVHLEAAALPCAGRRGVCVTLRREDRRERRAGADREAARVRRLAGVCHDLQTPLVAGRGFAQMIAEGRFGPVNPEQRDALERVLRGIDRAAALAANVGLLARSELGAPFRPASVAPSDVAAEVMEMRREEARRRKVRLEVQAPAADLRVLAERDDLFRALDNLVGNAIKFNREGGSVVVSWRDGAAGQVTMEVADTGPGISAEEREAIFEPFRRGSSASDRPGSGLGLAVVAGIVARHGAAIEVRTEPGQGSRFLVHWPRG